MSGPLLDSQFSREIMLASRTQVNPRRQTSLRYRLAIEGVITKLTFPIADFNTLSWIFH